MASADPELDRLLALEAQLRARDEELKTRAAESVARARNVLASPPTPTPPTAAHDPTSLVHNIMSTVQAIDHDIDLDLDAPRSSLDHVDDEAPLAGAGVLVREETSASASASLDFRRLGADNDTQDATATATATATGRPTSSIRRPTSGRKPIPALGGDSPAPPELLPEDSVEVDGLPSAANARLLRAKVTAQSRTILELQEAVRDRDRQLVTALADMKRARSERDAADKRIKQAEAERTRLAKTTARAEEEATSATGGIQTVKRELLTLEKEHKRVLADAKSREVRLTRALEEVDKLKAALAAAEAGNGAKGLGQQREMAVLQAENRRLERQKMELLGAFKKQMRLIDVLKRQKIHLEAARLLHFTEEEFMKALEISGRA